MALSLTHKANIDISPGSSVSPVINVSQYDAGSTIELTVYNEGVLMNTDGLQAVVCGRKADRKVFLYSVVCGAHTAIITTTNQMTAVDGDTLCEVRFIDVFTGQNIGTANFILAVEESPIKYTGDFSESDIPSIIDIDRAVAAASAIQNMDVTASTLPVGSEATVTKEQDHGHVSLAFGIPLGPQGPQGVKGDTGDAPVVELTTAQYDALTPEEKDADVLYCLTDGIPPVVTGADVFYDNLAYETIISDETGLSPEDVAEEFREKVQIPATNVQDALDMIAVKVPIIKEGAINGTTDSDGLLYNSKYGRILEAHSEFTHSVVLPYLSNQLLFLDVSTLQPVANTYVVATVRYLAYDGLQ